MIKNSSIKNLFLLTFLTFLFLLVCNLLLPALSDDFEHALRCNDGFHSAINRYLHWNGRLGELMLVSFAAALPPLLFDVINSLIGTLFLLIVYLLVFGRLPRSIEDRVSFALLLTGVITLTMFGSIFVWTSGAVNYLWGFLLIALWWVPIRFYLSDNKNIHQWYSYICYALLALSAGWCSEQVGIISIIIALVIFGYIIISKRKIPLWMLLGFIFFSIGFCLLYFCPGAQERTGEFNNYMSLGDLLMMGLVPMLRRVLLTIRFANSIAALNFFVLMFSIYKLLSLRRILKYIYLIIFVIIVALELYFIHGKYFIFTSILLIVTDFFFLFYAIRTVYITIRNKKYSLDFKIAVLFLVYFLSLLSTIQLLGDMPERAKFAQSMLLVVASLFIISELINNRDNHRVIRNVSYSLCVLVSLCTIYSYADYRIKHTMVVSEIENQKSKGVLDVELDKSLFEPLTSNIGDWGNPGENPSVWPNTSYAEHFGVNTITVR